MVGNAEVILGLVQLGLQAVHTGDGQHELRGVRPHLPWEERERGRGRERRCQVKKLVHVHVGVHMYKIDATGYPFM